MNEEFLRMRVIFKIICRQIFEGELQLKASVLTTSIIRSQNKNLCKNQFFSIRSLHRKYDFET